MTEEEDTSPVTIRPPNYDQVVHEAFQLTLDQVIKQYLDADPNPEEPIV